MDNILPEHFTNPLFDLLVETFIGHNSIYLDANTSFFPTLETISAAQASIPVGGRCATLAAQVAHVIFYLEVLERFVRDNDSSPVDWGEIWRRVEKVSDEEWHALQENLKSTYSRIEEMLRRNPVWNEDSIGGAMAVVVHSAYHLGEIRQAMCVLRSMEE